jgi:hypothetical protein
MVAYLTLSEVNHGAMSVSRSPLDLILFVDGCTFVSQSCDSHRLNRDLHRHIVEHIAIVQTHKLSESGQTSSSPSLEIYTLKPASLQDASQISRTTRTRLDPASIAGGHQLDPGPRSSILGHPGP